MTTLTQQQLDDLNNIQSITLEEFKTNYLADPTNSNAAQYYAYLRDAGFPYGELALGVVLNDTLRGQIANAYANEVAGDLGIDLSIGSDNWIKAQYRIMQRDFDAREANNGVDLKWSDIDTYHTAAFADVNPNLPPETWSVHTPLALIEGSNPDAADEMWNKLLSNDDSFSELIEDIAFLLTGAEASVDGGTQPYLVQVTAESSWLKDMADALVGNPILNSLSQAAQDLMDALAGMGAPTLQNIGDWIKEYADAGRAILQPITSILDESITDIVTGLQNAMLVEPSFSSDPVILDLNGNGITLSAMTSSHAYFGLNGNNFANRAGWVSGGDGLLAIDANADGKINDINELFGSVAQTGFAELAALDSNADNKITAADAQWNDLRVWVDADEDGYTDAGELKTLAELNITEIGLTVTASNTNINGNTLVETANFVMNGTNHTAGEVLFNLDPTNTIYNGPLAALSWEAMSLPAIRGYGTAADTPIAMSLDATLLAMGQALNTHATLNDFATFKTDLRNYLFKWAGVESVDPASRGAGLTQGVGNAQELAFLEKLTGINFITPSGSSDPNFGPGWFRVENTYRQTLENMALRWMVQNDANLNKVARYDLNSDEIIFTTTNTADLTAHAPATAHEAALYWAILSQIPPASMTAADLGLYTFILGQVSATDSNLTTAELAFFNIGRAYPNDPWVDASDNARNETMVGGSANDQTNYLAPNNHSMTQYGGGGNDILTGVSSRNIFIGGTGNDNLGRMVNGDIVYFNLGDGQDLITADGIHNTSSIVLASGIATGQVSYVRTGSDLFINVGTGGDLKILERSCMA